VCASLGRLLSLCSCLIVVGCGAPPAQSGGPSEGAGSQGNADVRLRGLWDTSAGFALELLPARKARAFPRAVVATMLDPVYKGERSWRGYPLAEILRTVPADLRALAADWQLAFECADGYRPGLSIEDALSGAGLLAFEGVGGEGWEPFQKGREWTTPDPFYLVWTSAGERRPWPYNVVKIVVERKAPATGTALSHPPAQTAGVALFDAHCQRCHSINGRGGTLGPELNVPKNVTEYWKRDQLRAFIRNAASFRLGSKMPIFESQLSEREIDEILSFLTDMRQHKVSRSPESRSGR
jgi:mono/diheme cytochrome c family protein